MQTSNFISSIWKFEEKKDANSVHNIFRWYGKLPPELVSKLLSVYGFPGCRVLANFLGSGTVLVECQKRNICCAGTDISPLSLLVSSVKTSPLNITNISQLTKSIIEKAKQTFSNENIYNSGLYDPVKWYGNINAQKILALKHEITKVSDTRMKQVLEVSLLSILRDCSYVDSRCVNHIVVNKNKKTSEVFECFDKAVGRIVESVKNLPADNTATLTIKESSADDLKWCQDGVYDLIISHPPYLNAVNYYNIYRMCTDLMDKSYSDIRNKDFSAKNYAEYLKLMKGTFCEAYRVLKKGGRTAVIIGDVRYKGNILTLGADFISLLKEIGFVIEDIFIWVTEQKAGMSVTRRGNFIDHNYIIIAKKA